MRRPYQHLIFSQLRTGALQYLYSEMLPRVFRFHNRGGHLSFTVITGQEAARINSRAVLPSNMLETSERPRVPVTIKSAFSFLARFRTCSDGFPSRITKRT